jgi:uncharacterized protein (TIGR02271 family)
MKHTLVAAFDELDQALQAKQQLVGLQILESSIDISSSAATSTTSTDVDTSAHTATHHDESFGEKVSHFFGSLFGNDDDDKPHRYATAYPEAYRRGATLLTVTVDTDDLAEKAEDILEHNGAIDIDERSATWGSDGAESLYANEAGNGTVHGGTKHIAGTHLGAADAQFANRTADITDTSGEAVYSNASTLATSDTDALAAGTAPLPTGSTAIPVIEENIRVGKREVNTGRVRVVSRVTERPVEETVSLHEEHAHIERRPVDRAVGTDELNSFKAGSIEIQETAEEVVVEKNARVVEEVYVGTRGTDHQETVRDTVRRTDVDIENEPGTATKHALLTDVPADRLKDR